jgi:hypothetical protein
MRASWQAASWRLYDLNAGGAQLRNDHAPELGRDLRSFLDLLVPLQSFSIANHARTPAVESAQS